MSDSNTATINPLISQQDISKHIKISEEFYTAYANHIRIAMSETDIRFFFGDSFPTATFELRIVENFSVAMSPQHAKLVHQTLTQIIEGYEKLFGPIKPPTPVPATIAIEKFSGDKAKQETE